MNYLMAFVLRIAAEAAWNAKRAEGGRWRDVAPAWCQLIDAATRLESEAS